MNIYQFLDLIGPLGILFSFLALIIATVSFYRWLLNREQSVRVLTNTLYRIKKNKQADLNKYRFPFFMSGMAIALGLTITAFNYPNFTEGGPVIKSIPVVELEQLMPTPITERPKPVPPKVEKVVKDLPKDPLYKEVNNYRDLEKYVDIDTDNEPVLEDEGPIIDPLDLEEEPVFDIPEEKATPVGGLSAFYKYLSKNLEYSREAKRLKLQGKVIVQFVINADGSIVDVKVIKGIDPLLDNEAIRVVQNSPKWNPGKFRGRAVRTRMVLPIQFDLR